jgi:hypothetical protein
VTAAPAPPKGLSLTATPSLVDVGGTVQFTLHAAKWPGPVSVTLGFLSPHHGFSGPMSWRPACSCFIAAVSLARRIHSLERARAEAKVHFDQSMVSVSAMFLIRGLAKNGRDFAPGGSVSLSGWVSDPTPIQKEIEHFCAWVKTADALGVPGYPVTYVVHYRGHNQTLRVAHTNKRGVACVQRSIGTAPIGRRVTVDMYAADQHVMASFQPRNG